MEKEITKLEENTTVIGMAQQSLIQKYGEATSQMIQAYKGTRYDCNGNDLNHQGRSLKEISEYKLNRQYKQQNIKQQSGFSAELLDEARKNKQRIIDNGQTRIRTTDGLGDTNNTQYDHVTVDESGQVIEGSGTQMKFLRTGIDKDGNRTFNVIDKLAKDEKWNRYDGKIDIPKGDYNEAVEYADRQIQKLQKQVEKAQQNGNIELANKLNKQVIGYEKAKERIREADVTAEEAIEARLKPTKFVAKEVIKDSHCAGVQAAKGAIIMSGSISVAQNLYAMIAEGKAIEEAVRDVTKTTAKSCVIAYGIGAGGTTLKSLMHSSSKELVRKIGTTNVPTMIATSAVEISKSIKRYAMGEIDEEALVEELGQKGTGMLAAGFASATGATVGGAIGSIIPVVGTAIGATVGGFIGSMIGYSASSMIYTGVLDTIKSEKISAERRIILEELSKKAIEEEENYRKKLTTYANEQYNMRESMCIQLFQQIKESILENNIDEFIHSMNQVGDVFGIELQFSSFKEIDEFMLDESTVFKL